MPKVSILVPVYGVEKYIERCARSLFEQTYEDIEYIFVNDCTKDNSISILENTIADYPKRKAQVTIINHQVNKGLAGARNTALKACTGEFLMHVDSDDYIIDNTCIEQTVAEAESTGAEIVIFDAMDVRGNTMARKTQAIPEDKITYLKLIASKRIQLVVWGILIKTSLYKDNNIHCVEGLNNGEDFMQKVQLIYHCKKYVHYAKPMYAYNHDNENSYSYSYSIKNYKQSFDGYDCLIDLFTNQLNDFHVADILSWGELYHKANALHVWAVKSKKPQDYYELRSFASKCKGFSKLPFKYKLSLKLSEFLEPKMFIFYYRVFSCNL